MPTQTRFPRLLEPGWIGNVRLKNRILKAPQHTGLANPDGSVTDRLLRYYRTVAEGGAGMVIVEYAWVDEDASRASPCQLGAARMDHSPGLSLLAQTIQASGAKAALQLSHAGRQRFLLEQPKAASPVPWEEIYAAGCPLPLELTIDEIHEIVKAFGQAARRARSAGFDMVELHACHGYLISNFLSARNNLRGDWYGGSLENRMRFLLEIVAEIKLQAGAHYPICARVSGTDYEPGGTTIEESIELCKRLEALGVAAIHVSGGNHHTTIHEVSPMGMSLAHNTWAAEAIKKEVSLPVIASGSITSPDLAESVLADGKGDFISLGRPLWADPEWPLKVKEGRPEDIRPCIRCNDGCLARGDHVANTIWCTVNVALCREELYAIKKSERPQRVAVVGGGPAGAEAARVATLMGHQVTLFEKRKIGGALHEAAIPEFKTPDFQPLIDYLRTQVEKLGVDVVEKEATAAELRDGSFDAVIVATGALPMGLDHVVGIDHPKVTMAMEVLHGEATVGDRVAVIGAGMVGTEVGLLLAEQGKTVTFVELLDDVMCGVTFDERLVYEDRFESCDVTNCCEKRLASVSDEGIVIVDERGRQTFIPADTVVLAIGSRPNRDLVESLREDTDLHVVEAGDCIRPRKIFDAIHDGHLAARLLDSL
jgi:2,4-dienoyl-CoA reductase-like NADH-dependent reductase (Old Yellow Enzyme family)/thioredoxin reductase